VNKHLKSVVAATLAVAGSAALAGSVAQVVSADGVTTNTYDTFAAAMAELSASNNRLTLLADAAVGQCFTCPVPSSGKEIVIDLGGRTLSVTAGESQYLFGLKDSFLGQVVISNGTVNAACGGLITMPDDMKKQTDFNKKKVVLADLTVRSHMEKSAMLVEAHCNLQMTRCMVDSDYMGGVWVGDKVGGSGQVRTAVLEDCEFVLRYGREDYEKPYFSTCVFVTDKSMVTMRNCWCHGTDAGGPARVALYQGASGGTVVVEGERGLYNGTMHSSTGQAANGIFIRDGAFTNCVFAVDDPTASDKYFTISGGLFDTDPGTNDNRYLDSGHMAVKLIAQPGQKTAYYVMLEPPGIDLGGGLTAYDLGDGGFLVKGSGELTNTSALAGRPVTNLIVGAGVTAIGANAFDGWRTLREVRVDTDCTNVGSQAFLECYNLTNASFAAVNPVTVGDHAFYRCNSLESLCFWSMPTFGEQSYTLQAGIYMQDGLPKVYSIPDIKVPNHAMRVHGTTSLGVGVKWDDVTDLSDDERKAYRFFKIVVQ